MGTFFMMSWFGRTLNVFSLAGMAFGIGMVSDNSVVVLENIYRHLQMGKAKLAATVDGSMEVWGANLASTLTTVAVFIPVVFMKEEVGQLFGDIAIGLGCSVMLSLLVSMTVVPCLSARILASAVTGDRWYHHLFGLDRLGDRFTGWISSTVAWINISTLRRLVLILTLTAGFGLA